MSEAEKLDPSAIPREMQERRQLAEELLTKAGETFGRGELLTATLHASDLLMLFPNERRYLDAFDEIVLSTDDPLSLLPVESGSVHVATAAGRARVLMMGRRLPEALTLLCKAVDVAPQVPYLHWIFRWLQPPIIQSLGWPLLYETAVRTAIRVGFDTPVPPPRHDPRVPNLRAGAEFIKAIRQIHPDQKVLWQGEVLIRRRLDDPGNVALAEEAAQRYPQDWGIRAGLLNVYRDVERPDDSLQQARIALEIDPTELSPLFDAGWAMLDGMRTEDALKLFQELVEKDPSYPSGKASLHWAHWVSTRSDQDVMELATLRERMWWDPIAVERANEVDPPVPYVNLLPNPADATANAAKHFARELGHVIRCCGAGGHIDLKIRSQYLESPSVPVAFDCAMRALGATGSLSIEIEELQTPDPRSDKAQVSTPIWRYEHTIATPVYPEGNPEAQQAIAEMARSLFRRDLWTSQGMQLAARFGNEGYHGLVSVLTHPPVPVDDEFDAITWTWRCQVATAITLSYLGGWEAGAARAGIYSMIYGPSDWISAAAIIALAWRASESANIRAEAEPIFEWMRSLIPEKGFTAWEGPLAEVWLALGHDADKRADLKEWVKRYHETLPDKNVVKPPERSYGGLNLEDYATFSAHRDRMLGKLGHQTIGDQIAALVGEPPEELVELCEQWKVPLRAETGAVYPYIREWQEAMNANPQLHARFLKLKRGSALSHLGVSAEEMEALDNIREGKQDVHKRMAQQQQAQAALAEDDDPDPLVFPGQPLERLSDYVGVLKDMQSGDMQGALSRRGLDMTSYATVAQAWGAKLAADPLLTERFHRLMQG